MPRSRHPHFQVLRPWWRSLSIGIIAVLLMGALILPQQAQTQAGDRISQIDLLEHINTESKRSGSEFLILDVRTAEEYAEGHIPGAVNIHFRDVPNHFDTLRDQNSSSIIVYCETGIRAGIARRSLMNSGFDSILHLEGDMQEWRRQNLPIVVLESSR